MAAELFARMMADPPELTNGVLLKDFLRERYNVAAARVDIMLREYLRFLAMAGVRHEMTVPSPLIDTIWHHHIEDTRAYQDYCDRLIGKFVHHTPNLETQSKHPGYPATLTAYELAFGEKAHPKVWPSMETFRKNAWIDKLFALGLILVFLGVFAKIFLQTTVVVALLGVIFLFIVTASTALVGPWSLTNNASRNGCGG